MVGVIAIMIRTDSEKKTKDNAMDQQKKASNLPTNVETYLLNICIDK